MIMTMRERQQEERVPDHVDPVAHLLRQRLFTMSMRMCSFASSVHGEHSRKTMLNSTHCSSSQEFDDMSNSFADDGVDRRDDDGQQDQP